MITYSTTMTSTSCQTSTVCKGENSKTTETAGVCENSIPSEHAAAFSAGATTVDGTAYPLALFPPSYPGGGASATVPYLGFSLRSSTSFCTGCYWVDGREVLCKEFNGCTKPTTTTITSTTPLPPNTVTVTVASTVSASCAYWIDFAD